MEHDYLKRAVMQRVSRIYYMRKFTQPLALKLYALGAAMLALGSLVSVSNVVANAANVGLAGMYDFARAALSGTELAVHVVLLVALVAAVLMAHDLLKTPARQRALA